MVNLKSDFAGFKAGTLLTCPMAQLLQQAAASASTKGNDKDDKDGSAEASTFQSLPWQVMFAPSARESLAGWTRTQNYLVVTTLDNVKSKVLMYMDMPYKCRLAVHSV